MSLEMKLIDKMNKIDCTVMETGLNKRLMVFYFCKCDPNQMDPICEECASKCHAGHELSIKYRGHQVCQCGIRCHNVYGTESEIKFDPVCNYHELSVYSRKGIYYETGRGHNICMFCYNFCRDTYEDDDITMKVKENPADTPSCECANPQHSDIKFIFGVSNFICDFDQQDFSGLTPIHLLNLLFKCPTIMNNVYGGFKVYHSKLKKEITADQNFQLDEKINLSNYYWSLINFANAVSFSAYFYYYDQEIATFFDFSYISFLLCKKLPDSQALSMFKNSVLYCFLKITLLPQLKGFPLFKVHDFENFPINLRIFYRNKVRAQTDFTQLFLGKDKNLIQMLISSIKSVTKHKLKFTVKLDELNRKIEILKIFAKLFLFSNEQIKLYCSEINTLFMRMAEFKAKNTDSLEKIEEKEFELLYNVVKTLYLFAIGHNDSVVEDALNKRFDEEEAKFLHYKTELGRIVNKSCTNLIYYVRKHLDGDSLMTGRVIYYANHLLMLCLSEEDGYLPQLEEKVTANYRLNNEETAFLVELDNWNERLERNFMEYFNFEVSIEELDRGVAEIVDSTLNWIGCEDFDPVSKRIRRSNASETPFLEKKQFNYSEAMAKSNLIFSLTKYVAISVNNATLNSNYKVAEQSFHAVMKFVYLFIDKSDANLFVVLSSSVVTSLFSVRETPQAKIILDFIYVSVKQLYSAGYSLRNANKLVVKLFDFYYSLTETTEDCSALYSVLKTVLVMTENIFSLNKALFISEIRAQLKDLFDNDPMIKDYKAVLLEKSKDFQEFGSLSTGRDGREDLDALASRAFCAYLTLVNLFFDDNGLFSDEFFLERVFSEEELLYLLKNINCDLAVRLELLLFYRMVYSDIPIEILQVSTYLSIFCRTHENKEGSIIGSEDLKVFKFLKEIMGVSNPKIINDDEKALIEFEIKNFSKIIEQSYYSPLEYRRYIEDSLLVFIRIFINKVFSIVHSMSGEEFLRIYSISVNVLEMKKIIYENNEKNSEFTQSIIKRTSAVETEELNKDIFAMKDTNFQAFDYFAVFSYLSKHIISLIKKPVSLNFSEKFGKKEVIEVISPSGDSQTEVMKALSQVYLNQKVDFEESSARQSMEEIHYEFEVNYRNLLVQYLLHPKSPYFEEIYGSWSNSLILRLLQYDTGESQEVLKKMHSSCLDLKGISTTFLLNLVSLILDSYNPASSVSKSEDYKVAYNSIKILKYLCEDHNNYFQHAILQIAFEMEDDRKIRFFDMMLLVLSKIMNLAGWDRVKSDETESVDYFYDIFSCIVELLIEVIQGNQPASISLIYSEKKEFETDSEFDDCKTNILPLFLASIKTILFRDSPESETIYCIRKELIDFLLAFLEEQNCSDRIKHVLVTAYPISAITASICSTLKKIYVKDKEGQAEEDKSSQIKANFVDNAFGDQETQSKKIKKYKTFTFGQEHYEYFLRKYYNHPEFSENSEFQLANNLFKLLKYMALQKNPEAENIFTKIEEKERAQTRLGYSQPEFLDLEFREIYYSVQFFEKFSKVIEVSKKSEGSESDEISDRIIIIYTEKPVTRYLSETSKMQFLDSVDRTSRYSKLFDMISQAEIFKQEIEYNSIYIKKNKWLQVANNINYRTIDMILFVFSMIINALMLIGEFHEFGEYGEGDNYYANGPEAVENKRLSFIYRLIYTYIAAGGLAFCIGVLILWFCTKFPLYYQIESKKFLDFKEKMQDEDDFEEARLKLFEKVFLVGLYNSVLLKRELTGILLFMFFTVLGMISQSFWIAFSFLLFILVNLIKTLSNIILAIKLKWEQMLTTLVFVFIITYIYSIIAFYFLNDEFVREVEGKDVAECSSAVYCMFTNLNYGIRVTAGIGDILPRRSFIRNTDIYMARFFFDCIYFAVVVVLLLNIVFGIIIDTFRELRIEGTKVEFDMHNICFVCGVTREELEKRKESFETHRKGIHNVWNYVYYVLGLMFEDPQELNANNSYVLELLENRDISWLPEN